MLVLHYYPSNASLAPHMLLRELRVPFELQLVDRSQDLHKSPEYRRLNPNARIPALQDGDLVLWESAAICLHLIDRHPQSELSLPLGSADRARLYKWLAWLSNTLQPELMLHVYPERWAPSAQAELRASAAQHIAGMLDIAEAALEPHLLGPRLSAADFYFAMLCRWTRNMERPARSRPRTARLLAALLERPSVLATFEAEGLQPPFF